MDKEGWNQRYESMDDEEPGPPSPILRRLLEERANGSSTATGSASGRALDLAAGIGRNAIHLARLGWTVTAVDFSEAAVARGRSISNRLDLPITWLTEDLTTYRPPEQSFDLVCLFYLHLPWDTMAGILEAAVGAVSEQGHLLVVGHDLGNLTEGSGGPQNPHVLYTPAQVSEVIEPGLSVTYAASESNEIDHGDPGQVGRETVTQIDAVVIATRRIGTGMV